MNDRCLAKAPFRALAKAAFRLGILGVVFMPLMASAQEKHKEWAYKGEDGPENWGKLDPAYAACLSGHTQSPINIQGAKKSELPPLRFDYKAVPMDIIDNGHSIEVIYAPGSRLTVGDKTYTLKQFHFHHPSEEHIEGRGYDLSAHLVHADEAGHLAVVTVLLKRGGANALIDSVWKNIPAEKEKEVDVQGVTVNIKDLLPADHGYFTYAGSLTTPPCSEGVTWYVLRTPVTISDAQLARFVALYPNDARPIQPSNQREILESK